MCKTALQTYCHDETVQTILDGHLMASDTLNENGWANLAYEVFDALFPNGKTTTYLAPATAMLWNNRQNVNKTSHSRPSTRVT